MTDFEKYQIKRQLINDQLPLKIINSLDFEEHSIKDAFTTKSRFILPKSEHKVFNVDDEFMNAFSLLSLDEKIAYYSKQINLLTILIQSGGASYSQEDQFLENDISTIECKVKGKGLGQWQDLTLKLIIDTTIIQIPHKTGNYKIDLHDYLMRQTNEQGGQEIVFQAIKPNIPKHWRLKFPNQQIYKNSLNLITTMANRALKKQLQDSITNFQQSRVINSRSNFKKRSQIDIQKPSLLQVSKHSSHTYQQNTSILPDNTKIKKSVNFHPDHIKNSLNIRQQTSIIDNLSVLKRLMSPPAQYEPPQQTNLFDSQQDWFIKILGESQICSKLFDQKQPQEVLSNNEGFRSIYENGNNRLFHHKTNKSTFKIYVQIKFPREIVLAALCEVDKWSIWNRSVQQACIKLRIPASNLIICKIGVKPLSNKYRPRQLLFLSQFFVKNKQWFIVMTSIKDGYYPVQDDSVRAKLSRCLFRLKEKQGGTLLEAIFDIKNLGQLNFDQDSQLSRRLISGFFQLESCLKDRIFVQNKASSYFDLNWSCQKFHGFVLGKNNELDDTSSFTSNLCSQIDSFYSVQGPADWGMLDQMQIQKNSEEKIILNYQQRPFSFKKKKQEDIYQSKLGAMPIQKIENKINESKLPFKVPVQNNKVVLNQQTKKKIESYIRLKQQQRVRNNQSPELIKSKFTDMASSKLPVPSKLNISSIKISQHQSQQLSSNNSFKGSKNSMNDRNQPLTPPVQKSIIPMQKSIVPTRKSSVGSVINNSNPRTSVTNLNGSYVAGFDVLTKRNVSKIEIDKYNPQQHIVPYSDVKLHPESELVILPNDYLEKWVSLVPITTKKTRVYKGEDWDHFLFRDLWTVLQNGDVKCVNQSKLQVQSSAIKLVLKRFASNVMSGKGILNVSLPVQIFSQLSCLELIARSLCFAPFFLQKAANSDNPIERFKIVNAFSLATSLLYIEMQKPFNPILGQTYQGWIAGCPIYCEQISHHPPISAFYFVGRGYTVSGHLQPTIDLSLNSGVGWNQGELTIAFSKYPSNPIRIQSPAGEITGLAYGDRKFNFTGKNYSYDLNGLFCEMVFNPTKKGMLSFGKQEKQSDYLKGNIVRVSPQFINKYRASNAKKRQSPSNKQIIQKIAQVEGRWTVGLSFNGVQYFNVSKDIPTMLQQQKYPLNSNCNYRQDIHYRRIQNYTLSQTHKQRLQILQRNDKKLRQQRYPKGKH